MQELEMYRPIDLTATQTKELHALMASSFVALSRAAKEKYGFPKVKHLRDDYKHDPSVLWFDPRAKLAMNQMIDAEDLIVRGNIRLAAKLAVRFDKYTKRDRPGVTCGDYIQECAAAIYNAQYMFDGRGEFSTYVRWCMRNQLISFIREEETASGVGKVISQLREQVKQLMRAYNFTFEEALARVRLTTEISEDNAERLRDAMYAVRRGEQQESSAVEEIDNDDDREEMWAAVKQARLTDIQRRLVEAHLRGDREFRRRLSETEINPNTGNCWTPQRLSQLFCEACLIIRAVYEGSQRAA